MVLKEDINELEYWGKENEGKCKKRENLENERVGEKMNRVYLNLAQFTCAK